MLSLQELREAVRGNAAAFRCVTKMQPVGGPGDKVFPPTYEGGRYAEEKRRVPGIDGVVDCVLLDSVQSQANRMELALLDAWQAGQFAPGDAEQAFPLPVISVDFKGKQLLRELRITSLDAPHRIADALLRDSQLKGQFFRKSDIGKLLDNVDNRNATALLQYCPTALVFGMWDSTGPRGGLGAKFARAIVSELVGIGAVPGVKTASRIDPAQIAKAAGPVFRTPDGSMTTFPEQAAKIGGKPALYGLTKKGELIPYDPKKDSDDGKPSKANHGNVTPSLRNPDTREMLPGGFTLQEALMTTVLSLPALRRLSFPLATKKDGTKQADIDIEARTVLAALGLCAATLLRESGCDLRSRCQLHPVEEVQWELVDKPGTEHTKFTLSGSEAKALYREAVAAAKAVGLLFEEQEIPLTPSPQLVALVKKSQELNSSVGEVEQ